MKYYANGIFYWRLLLFWTTTSPIGSGDVLYPWFIYLSHKKGTEINSTIHSNQGCPNSVSFYPLITVAAPQVSVLINAC